MDTHSSTDFRMGNTDAHGNGPWSESSSQQLQF
jgi:hypothetical protein